MTKSQKKLDRVKLTEEEKKALDNFYRREAFIDTLLMILALIAGIVALLAITEVFE